MDSSVEAILLFIIFTIFGWGFLFAGAYFHERDLARNFNETGNAKAWFVDIKCKTPLEDT